MAKILFLPQYEKRNSSNWVSFSCLIDFYIEFFNPLTESIIRFLILKQNEFWKFFIFHLSISKLKLKNERTFLKFIFWFDIKKWIRKFWFLFFEIGFKSKQIQKKNFSRFSFFNSIIKFEKWNGIEMKWKIFFEISFLMWLQLDSNPEPLSS